MGQTNFLEEIDCGSFFDHIDDLIDFPVDDVVEPVVSDSRDHFDFGYSGDMWPSLIGSLPPPAADLSAELAVPYEDIVQLEWLSKFVEDSFSERSTQAMVGSENAVMGVSVVSSRHQFQTSSPVSVLESSSSCSVEKSSPRSPEVAASARCGRARSKRPRPASFIPRPTMQVPSNAPSSASETTAPIFNPKSLCDSENFAESRLVIKIPNPPEQQKKKKIKITVPVPLNHVGAPVGQQQAIRKCMHCEITKTPQWRAGPMGPKTLCNACGVRYKSGRLFPEYRPAASPTFVATVHSNSHKKVLEMRNKSGEKVSMVKGAPMMVASNSPEMIPNNSSIVMEYM